MITQWCVDALWFILSVVSITEGLFFKLSDGLAMNQRLLTEPGASRAGTLPGSSRRIVGHAYGAGDLPGGWIVAVAGPPRRLRPPVASQRLSITWISTQIIDGKPPVACSVGD